MSDPQGLDAAPGVVSDFLLRYLDDHAANSVRTLEDYQSLYPGFEAVIAAEFARLNATGSTAETAPEAPSTDAESIAGFTIRRVLGRGGMGIVYLADQFGEIARPVALKVVKLGMDTREVVARFASERRVLARLDHPGIAKVFDAGVTAAGRPYFAMELVDGAPLLEFANERDLSVPDRLRIFLDICAAIRHAHQKGVIHRDLKPSNILVAERDGRPEVKVIDFGIAKSIDATASDTPATAIGQIVGTPGYMSPEQALHGGFDLDTRTDIYSLGAVLYVLLTGSPPFATTPTLTALENLRRIAEDEPLRPSARVRSDARRPPVVTRALASRLAGDLDGIVLQAMEKDRERRYASVSELAADIGRHLANEPVLARRQTPAYRLGKFAVRHRRVILGLSAAAIITTVIAAMAAHQRDRRHDEQRRAALASLADEGRARADGWREALAQVDALDGEWRRARSAHAAPDPIWKRPDEVRAWVAAREAAERRDVLFSRAVTAYENALELAAPDEAPAIRSSVIDLYRRRHELIYWQGEATLPASFFASLIDAVDPGASARTVSQGVRFIIDSAPRGASVHCFRYEFEEGRVRPRALQSTPNDADDALVIEAVRDGVDTELLAGDVLQHVDGTVVGSLAELHSIVAQRGEGADVNVEARRNGRAISARWRIPSEAESPPDIGGLRFAAYPLALGVAIGDTAAGPVEVSLPHGSYLIVLRRDGFVDARLPVHVPWLPEASPSLRVRLLPAPRAPAGFLPIAAGPTTIGGDDEVDNGLARDYRAVDDFLLARHETTVAEWIRFLDARSASVDDEGFAPPRVDWSTLEVGGARLFDLVAQGPSDAVARGANGEPLVRLVPMQRVPGKSRPEPLVDRDPTTGRFAASRKAPAEWPVLGISHLAALEYAKWRTEECDGRFRFRLPTDREWERAARGADRRIHVWGDYPLASFCLVRSALARGRPAPVGTHPFDESVFGVRDLAGSVSEAVLDRIADDVKFLSSRGGNWWAYEPYFIRAANRIGRLPTAIGIDLGVRLAADWPADPTE